MSNSFYIVKNKIRLYLILSTLICSFPGTLHSQVTPLWESSSTFGDKGTLYSFGSTVVEYYFVLDSVSGQCKIYNADTFTLVSTITGLGHSEYPYILVADMNGNGQAEIVFQDYASTGYLVKIRDIITGTIIKTWGDASNSYYLWSLFKSPGSSTVKISMYKTNLVTYQSSLSIYSLGITMTGAADASWDVTHSLFDLKQNFPNPFNPSTTIAFNIQQESPVKLTVFDTAGKVVKILINGTLSSGTHSVRLDASDLAAGVYYYQINSGNSIIAKKMILIR